MTDKSIWVYCDGACKQTGEGGYGVVIINDGKVTRLSGGYSCTTNNRMELLAVITALEYLPENSTVCLVCDSMYVLNSMALGWYIKWSVSGYTTCKNPTLWSRVQKLLPKFKSVTAHWVRGHEKNYYNELADSLASLRSEMSLIPDNL